MNRHGVLTLGTGVVLMIAAACLATSVAAPRSSGKQLSVQASSQVAAHAVKRSGYIVASS
jgi:hypothetical protein